MNLVLYFEGSQSVLGNFICNFKIGVLEEPPLRNRAWRRGSQQASVHFPLPSSQLQSSILLNEMQEAAVLVEMQVAWPYGCSGLAAT